MKNCLKKMKTIVSSYCRPFFLPWPQRTDVLQDAGVNFLTFISLSLCLSFYLSVHPSVYLSICLFVQPSIHPTICPFVCPSTRPSVCPSVCPSVRLSVCPLRPKFTPQDHKSALKASNLPPRPCISSPGVD